MDDTDLRLLRILNSNSRTPVRELADQLGISVQAVHRRLQELVEKKVIECFTANLSLQFLKATPIGIFGFSNAKDVDDSVRDLGKEGTSKMAHVSGNFVSIMGILRSMEGLDNYIQFVRDTLLMENPTVNFPGGMGFNRIEHPNISKPMLELSQLDYRIIFSLHKDSRKVITDIAKELGVSAATVKRRLTRLIDSNVIEFSTDFNVGAEAGYSTLTFIHLIPNADKTLFFSEVKENFGARVIFMATSSTIADSVALVIWSASMKASNEMEEIFRKSHFIDDFKTYLIQNKHHFSTWREKTLEEKAREE